MTRHFTISAAIIAMAAPAFAETVSIETALGAVELESQPETIAVLDIAQLDILDALGVSGLNAPDKTYFPHLAEYGAGLGTLHEPDYEAINALAPDLVVAANRSSSKVEDLSKLATTIDMTMRGYNLIDYTRTRITDYGTLFGLEDKAAELVATLEAELSETQELTEGRGNALIVMTNGGKISAYGAEGRFGWLHNELGLAPVIEDIETVTHGEAISFEFIAETNPDWILVLDRAAAIGQEGESAAATLNNSLVAGTTAGQNGQIVYLPSAEVYVAGGGYTSTIKLLDAVQAAFGGTNS
ncbi:iron ABC transporter substrate-binding protein [Marivivens niveibacter]|uniref:Iron ABC transporter substrate-binding protein n=1 Tax=Marivivens niveibacter TaxID=1930667 RepID=A0A251X3L2_9RHOB|nr:siderophore ABC transporter substrate-binding protein [Marivivens niveibacter]OUD10968.1 iron ABC transporter substrate-binding protein [Marivivens niveibacter]